MKLDHALNSVRVPGLKRRDEEHLFKKADVALAGLVVYVDATTEFRVVHELRGVFCEQTNKSRQCGKSFYVGNITQIARQDRSEIRPSPIVSAPFSCALRYLREASCQHEFNQIASERQFLGAGKRARKDALQERRRSAEDLRARQWEKVDDFHAASEAVGDSRQLAESR